VSEFSIAVLSLAACVFGTSAAAKIRSRRAYRSFRAGLRETALIPQRLLPVAASVLPGAEAVTAAGLTAAAVLVATAGSGANVAAAAALTAASLLTAVLAAGVAVVMRSGAPSRCNCFGAGSDRPLGGAHLIRNVALLAVLAAGVAGTSLRHGQPAAAGAIVAAAAGVVVALLFIRWEELAELFAPIGTAATAATATTATARRGSGPR
jgi:Methylamine utilisation protein MauE